MESSLSSVGLRDQWVKPVGIFVLAAVIILLIVIFVMPYFNKKEGYTSVGYALDSPEGVTGALSSGATIRRLGTMFTQPGQGEHTTVYIPEIKEAAPYLYNESLVGIRQEPDYFAVGSILDDYTRGSDGLSYERAEEAKLAAQVYG